MKLILDLLNLEKKKPALDQEVIDAVIKKIEKNSAELALLRHYISERQKEYGCCFDINDICPSEDLRKKYNLRLGRGEHYFTFGIVEKCFDNLKKEEVK